MKVLLIEDDPDLAKSLRDLLETRGFQIFQCDTEEDARRFMEERGDEIDVAILEMRLPHKKGAAPDEELGLEVIKFLRARHPQLPSIVFTAFPTYENAVRSMKAGAFDYVSKSGTFSVDHLFSALDKAAEKRRVVLERVSGASGEPPTRGAPAYFRSLTVKNVTCFGPSQTVDLCSKDGRPAQWTLILGNNGTGKTALLRCLASLEVVFNKRRFFQRHRLTQDMWNYLRVGDAPGEARSGRRDYLIGASVACGQKLTEPSGHREVVELSITSREDEPRDTRLLEDARQLRCFGYGAARRIGTSSLSEEIDEFGCRSLFDDGASLINAEEWLVRADYYAAKDSNKEKCRDTVREILLRLLPDVRELEISQETSSPVVKCRTSDGWVTVRDLSLGYQTLIAWTVDLAARLFQRYPDAEDPLACPAVVLVDEIDLHLHPKFQRGLLDFLSDTFKNTQFIATAHSPLVVQAASEKGRLVLLKREGNHVVVANDPVEIRHWRVDQILTCELFGVPSARPKGTQRLMQGRADILSKPKLTKSPIP